MCYNLMISTNSDIDLSRLNTYRVFFSKSFGDNDRSPYLKYKNKWRLATCTENGCSCHFRIHDADIGFCPLQDWMDEEIDDEEVIDTRWLFQIIKNLVDDGFKLDSLCAWEDVFPMKNKVQKIVKVNEIKKEHFAFFEDVYFDYV